MSELSDKIEIYCTDKISSLGWTAKTNLYEMFEKTIASLRIKFQLSK